MSTLTRPPNSELCGWLKYLNIEKAAIQKIYSIFFYCTFSIVAAAAASQSDCRSTPNWAPKQAFCAATEASFYDPGIRRVRKGFIPGNSKMLWRTIHRAKVINNDNLPKKIFEDGQLIQWENLPDQFAYHFEKRWYFLLQTL